MEWISNLNSFWIWIDFQILDFENVKILEIFTFIEKMDFEKNV
jgi:hypothetical protein